MDRKRYINSPAIYLLKSLGINKFRFPFLLQKRITQVESEEIGKAENSSEIGPYRNKYGALCYHKNFDEEERKKEFAKQLSLEELKKEMKRLAAEQIKREIKEWKQGRNKSEFKRIKRELEEKYKIKITDGKTFAKLRIKQLLEEEREDFMNFAFASLYSQMCEEFN